MVGMREQIDKLNKEIDELITSEMLTHDKIEKLKEARDALMEKEYNPESLKGKYYKFGVEGKYIRYVKVNDVLFEKGYPCVGVQGICIILHICDDFKGCSMNNLVYWVSNPKDYTEISKEEFEAIYTNALKELSL